LVAALVADIASASPIPTALARNLDSHGIGVMIGAGPVYDGEHGLAPNQLISQIWYHYYPTLIGGAGLEFSSRNPSRFKAFTSTRYDMTATWIAQRTDLHLVELSLIADLMNHNGYVDTAARIPGADAQTDIGTDIGVATRIGYGRRYSTLVGWWVAGSPGVSIRVAGSNTGVNYGFDGEFGMTISIQSIWYDSKTLTRAWDLFLRLPFRIESSAPDVTPQGVRRIPDWRIGIQVGPTALF
jgi:hypothetical protein